MKKPKTHSKKNATVLSSKKTSNTRQVKRLETAVTQNAVALQTDNFISVETAHTMVLNARDAKLSPAAMDFPKSIFEELLSQNNINGIRIYTAIDENGQNTFVITGYDENRSDVYINRNETMGAIDLGQICDKDIKVYNNDVVMLF